MYLGTAKTQAKCKINRIWERIKLMLYLSCLLCLIHSNIREEGGQRFHLTNWIFWQKSCTLSLFLNFVDINVRDVTIQNVGVHPKQFFQNVSSLWSLKEMIRNHDVKVNSCSEN